MPSPVAHIGAALALLVGITPPGGWPAPTPFGRWLPTRLTVAAAFAAIAPDLDILVAFVLPTGLDWHRGPSHSLIGAALIGAVTALSFRLRGPRPWAVTLGAALLHVPFDWSTGVPGAPAHYGVPWVWPFSSTKWIDPNPWFGAYHIDKQGFLANMWSPAALPVYLGELGTVCVLVVCAAVARRLYLGLTSTNS